MHVFLSAMSEGNSFMVGAKNDFPYLSSSSLLAHCSLLIAHCSADNDEHIIQVGRVGGDQNTAGNEDK